MSSKLYSIDYKDFINGLFVAVGSAVFLFLADLLKVPGFNYYQIPWSEIGTIALGAFVGYLQKKFFSTPDGKIFGKIG